MTVIYDDIGLGYNVTRRTDPKIAKQIEKNLVDATKIINLGAGTGSYEPLGVDLIAVEPSKLMIEQRAANAYPVKQAFADNLPFRSNYFSHAMTVLSMHHWQNRRAAFSEIKRVTTDKFVAVTWFPHLADFWLTKDYFPEIHQLDSQAFPSLDEFEAEFNSLEITPLLVPEDCQDGFLACFWKRPTAYLQQSVRKGMSTFSKIRNLDDGLWQLENDLKTGLWHKKNSHILESTELDVGYRIVTAKL